MKAIKIYSVIFMAGALIYSAIELVWRGYTHYTMAIAGGTCFAGLYRYDEKKTALPMRYKCLIGAAMITAVEFAIGCIVNKLLRLNVWDYSGQFMNIMGQICPLYTVLWAALCYPAFLMCRLFRNIIFKGGERTEK